MSNRLSIAIAIVIQAHKFPPLIERELMSFAGNALTQPQRSVRNKKQVSQKTIEARIYGVCSSIGALIELGFKVRSLDNVGEKHIAALHAAWTQSGGPHEKSVGRIHNLNCYLRLLFDIHLRKSGLVRSVDFYDSDCKRTYVAATDKSWNGHAVDAEAIIAGIAASGGNGQIVAAQLELSLAFGLRVQEAWLARPLELLDEAINRESARIQHGTKGGRPREVPVSDLVQLDVLMRVAAFARGERQTMIPARYTLPQWRNTYYAIVRACGVRRDDTNGGLGVTSHGLRHQYLHGVYRQLTGVDAPIKGGMTIDLHVHRSALKTLIEHAGHSDVRKASAYLGSPSLIRKLGRLKASISDSETVLSDPLPDPAPTGEGRSQQ